MDTQVKSEIKIKKESADLQKIRPFLWFNDNAEEAVKFYVSIFNRSSIINVLRYGKEGPNVAGRPEGSVMTMDFQIEGQSFAAINGGPVFEINPSVSFFVNCETSQEIDRLWGKLSEGGTILMELDKYPFSDKYGWVQDKFGVSWQLILPDRAQKITPCFMFTGEQHKRAEEAIHFYSSVFKNSSIIQLERYTSEVGPEGGVVHCKFTLDGQEFVAMDSHMVIPINFNPAISLVVHCNTQEEVDYYWDKLSEGADKGSQQCGWLNDKFGFSWQVVPTILVELLADPDPVKAQRVMQTMLQMKKLDIKALKQAYKG